MKKIINTKNAPKPIGPYNQAILTGDTLYISGQIPIDPQTDKIINTSIEASTIQVMENLKAVLTEAGLSFNNVVKSSIFVKNMENFNEINKVYASYFDEVSAPARETIEVSNLPKSVNVEISMIAITSI